MRFFKCFFISMCLLHVSACSTASRMPASRAEALKNHAASEYERLKKKVTQLGDQGVSVLADDKFTDATWTMSHIEDALGDEEALLDLDIWVQTVERQLKAAEDEAKTVRPKIPDVMKARDDAIQAGADQYPREKAELLDIDEDLKMTLYDFSEKKDRKSLPKIKERYERVYLRSLQNTHLDDVRNSINAASVKGATQQASDMFQTAKRDLEIAEQAIVESPRRPESFKKAVERARKSATALVKSSEKWAEKR